MISYLFLLFVLFFFLFRLDQYGFWTQGCSRVNIWFQKKEMDKVRTQAGPEISDFSTHMFTDTCLHNNMPDQQRAERWWGLKRRKMLSKTQTFNPSTQTLNMKMSNIVLFFFLNPLLNLFTSMCSTHCCTRTNTFP